MLFGVQAIKNVATYDVAVERLRQRFHLGLVAPGSKLPAERRLAEELHVARATLREALRVLATEGYVEIRRGVAGGAIVPSQGELLKVIQRRAKGDLAARYRALEYWEIVQSASAPFAAERRTLSAVKRLRSAAECLVKSDDAWERRAAEAEICLTVANASGNAWMINAIHDSLAATYLPFADLMDARGEFPQDDVDGLVAAISDADQLQAKRSMTAIALAYGSRLRPRRRETSRAADGEVERGRSPV